MSSFCSAATLLLAAILAAAPAPRAQAYFIFPLLGLPEKNSEIEVPIELDPHLPFFTEAAANLVVRMNPNSERMADPALRAAALTLITLGTRGNPAYPKALGDLGTSLSWAEPGRSMTAYGLALEDFGGPFAPIDEKARVSGMVTEKGDALHELVQVGRLKDRKVLRGLMLSLENAGYTLDATGRLVGSDGEQVKLYFRPANMVTGSQESVLDAITSVAQSVGISFTRLEQLNFNPDSVFTADALISLEPADRLTSIEAWLKPYSKLPEVGTFLDAVGENLRPHRQLTSLYLVDDYLTKAAWVASLASIPSNRDISTEQARLEMWKPLLALAHLEEVCEENNPGWKAFSNARTGGVFVNSSRIPHPLMILLPGEGGSEETLVIGDFSTEVGIEESGFLVFRRPEQPEGEAPRADADEWVEVPVVRDGVQLIMQDANPYLELMSEYAEARQLYAPMMYRDPHGSSPDARQGISDGDVFSLAQHYVRHSIVDCARVLAESNEPLVFGPASSLQ